MLKSNSFFFDTSETPKLYSTKAFGWGHTEGSAFSSLLYIAKTQPISSPEAGQNIHTYMWEIDLPDRRQHAFITKKTILRPSIDFSGLYNISAKDGVHTAFAVHATDYSGQDKKWIQAEPTLKAIIEIQKQERADEHSYNEFEYYLVGSPDQFLEGELSDFTDLCRNIGIASLSPQRQHTAYQAAPRSRLQ